MVSIKAEPEAKAEVKAEYPPPEKVHTLDPKIAKAHTTFYNNKKTALMTISAEPEKKAEVKADYPPPEKVHTLDPKIAKAHTTFYNNKKSALVSINAEPEAAAAAPEKKAEVKTPEPEKV